jgi:spoIIIJ-associated protein
MEWVETTARTRQEATELALDQLGVVLEEAEVVVLEEPRPGLFGRMRGEARVRARVRPAPVRPKQERRRGGRNRPASATGNSAPADSPPSAVEDTVDSGGESDRGPRRRRGSRGSGRSSPDRASAAPSTTNPGEPTMSSDEQPSDDAAPAVAIDDVRDAAVQFVTGLTDAFGFEATVDAQVDGSEIEVQVAGTSLGLLIGPGGRTLLGIQDLARVAAQRRLGDHDTRLRVDVAGYREKRRLALERFAASVAEQVKETGVARSLDPMPSADRKVLHDALAEIDGVVSRSEGEEPHRRVIVAPG